LRATRSADEERARAVHADDPAVIRGKRDGAARGNALRRVDGTAGARDHGAVLRADERAVVALEEVPIGAAEARRHRTDVSPVEERDEEL